MSQAEKEAIVGRMILLMNQLERVEFQNAGPLTAGGKLPQSPYLSTTELDPPIVSAFTVGRGDGKRPVQTPRGTSLKDLIIILLNGWIEHQKKTDPVGLPDDLDMEDFEEEDQC